MNKHQENLHTMHKKVEHVCDENTGICQGIVAFANAVATFKANNQKIDDTAVKQKTPTTGYTEKRDTIKTELAELAIEIAGSIAAYAHENKDEVLARKVGYSFTELTHASDAAVKNRVTIIFNEAKNSIDNLGDYGTDKAQITQLEQKLNDFKEIVGKKGYSKEETQTATEQVAELLAENNELLKNRLDKLMLKFRVSAPEFYKNYFNARDIYDFGGGRKNKVPEVGPPQV
jgi:hypothetical protein